MITKKKTLTAILAGAMLVTSLAGCGGKTVTNQQASEVIYNGDEIYPIQCADTLEYWTNHSGGGVLSGATDLGQTPLGQELMKQTGINIKFMHPAQGQVAEQFNIMLASDELPDVIEYAWFAYSGGPDKAIEEKYIISLDDVWEKFMPNVSGYIKEHPEYEKEIKTAKGHFFTVPGISEAEFLRFTSGMIVRKDWLDEAGLEVPTTIDEWETVLEAFKKNHPEASPMGMAPLDRSSLMAAYGLQDRFFYVDGEEMKFGSYEPAYKDFLLKFKDWYDRGLVDNDMPSLDSGLINNMMINDEIGSTYGWAGSSMGTYLNATNTSESFSVVAAPYPTLNKGEKPEYGGGALPVTMTWKPAITTQCVNVELAARLIDYGYTEAGHMLFNFGVEGESYNMVDGYPVLTDLITNNPEGLAMSKASQPYIRAATTGPMITDPRYYEQFYAHEEQLDATKTWVTNGVSHLVPTLYVDAEAANEYATIMADINTYVDESFISFMTGTMKIEDFDKYIAQLKEYGMERAIEIQQKAFNDYLKR